MHTINWFALYEPAYAATYQAVAGPGWSARRLDELYWGYLNIIVAGTQPPPPLPRP
jgi:hypothetical protein